LTLNWETPSINSKEYNKEKHFKKGAFFNKLRKKNQHLEAFRN